MEMVLTSGVSSMKVNPHYRTHLSGTNSYEYMEILGNPTRVVEALMDSGNPNYVAVLLMPLHILGHSLQGVASKITKSGYEPHLFNELPNRLSKAQQAMASPPRIILLAVRDLSLQSFFTFEGQQIPILPLGPHPIDRQDRSVWRSGSLAWSHFAGSRMLNPTEALTPEHLREIDPHYCMEHAHSLPPSRPTAAVKPNYKLATTGTITSAGTSSGSASEDFSQSALIQRGFSDMMATFKAGQSVLAANSEQIAANSAQVQRLLQRVSTLELQHSGQPPGGSSGRNTN